MAYQYVVDINHNDDLPTVIRKCNENFKAILAQRSKISQIETNDYSTAIEDLGNAIASESLIRSQDDDILQGEIDTLSGQIVSANNYNVLSNKPAIKEPYLGIYQNSLNENCFGPTINPDNNTMYYDPVTIQGQASQNDYMDLPFTTTEIDVIIQTAERAGAI